MSQIHHTKYLIIGGGIAGCSTAYHLTQMGEKDVVLLEKNGLTHGATWHAAGLVGQLRSSLNTTRMLQESVKLYDKLEKESEFGISWKKVGSLRLACSPERLKEIKGAYTLANSYGIEMHLVNPDEALDLFPIMSKEGIQAAAYIPEDGYIDPSSVTQELAKQARKGGATIKENTKVVKINSTGKRVFSLETESGETYCFEKLVVAAGMWSHEIGQLCQVQIPAIALEHQYLVTDDLPSMPDNLPTMRDPDNLVYYKPEMGGLAIGGYEPDTLPFGSKGISPAFGQELLQENFDRFEQLAVGAGIRTPIVNEVGVRKLINGPIPYSADGDFIMGKAPEYDNLFVNSGFLYGIAAGGGAGLMMAQWLVEGQPALDLWPLDIRRFYSHHNSRFFMEKRAVELYGKHYTLHWPHEEHSSARDLRLSPLHETLKQKGAVFGSRGGWERPLFFAKKDQPQTDSYSFDKAVWFENVAEEHKAVREKVALIDQSSFSKMEVRGKGSLEALQKLCVSNLDKPVGTTVYTQLCNERGGIESDLTISRIGNHHFYIVTGSAFGVHDLHWIESHLPENVVAYDCTSSRAVINICGPNARATLEKACDFNLNNESFKFSQCREFFIGAAKVLAIRVGYVGELGWELHVPTEFAKHVYDLLWEAGQEFEISNIGYRAIDTLRMEKGYLYWSSDISPDYNPYEANLGFKVHLKSKGDFLGRAALEKVKAEGVKRKLFSFTLDSFANVRGGEAIISDGKVVAETTSGNFGHTIGKPIVMGYLPRELWNQTEFEVEVYGEKFNATKHDQALYDPQMLRLKC